MLKNSMNLGLYLCLGSIAGCLEPGEDVDQIIEEDQQEQEVDELDLDITSVSRPAAVGCTGSGCNYKDPSQMGCSADAVTPQSPAYARKNITGDGQVYGYVEMRYSASCKAQWGCVKNYGYITTSKVALRSESGGTTYSPKTGSPPFKKSGYHCTTMMAGSATVKYRVDGAIQRLSGSKREFGGEGEYGAAR